MNTLDFAMQQHGSDKHWLHHYTPYYTRHFDPIRDRELVVVEIGVGGYGSKNSGGRSLRAWKNYFTTSQVFGIDVEPKSFVDEPRIRTILANQSNPSDLSYVLSITGPPDIVIDDGSHVQSDTLTAFEVLFDAMNPGGIYVIEDLSMCYTTHYGGNAEPLSASSPNVISDIGKWADAVQYLHWCQMRSANRWQKMISEVHVYQGIVFVYKRTKFRDISIENLVATRSLI